MKQWLIAVSLILALALPALAQETAQNAAQNAAQDAAADTAADTAAAPAPAAGMGMGMMGKGMGMMGKGMGMGQNKAVVAMMRAHMIGAERAPLSPGKAMLMAAGPGRMGAGSPMIKLGLANLSPQQWDQVRKLAYDSLKARCKLEAKMTELRLEAAYLGSADKIDIKALTNAMSEQGAVRAQLLLNARSYLDGLSGILTPEQIKAAMAPCPMGMGMGMGKGMGMMGKGKGMGMGQGKGQGKGM